MVDEICAAIDTSNFTNNTEQNIILGLPRALAGGISFLLTLPLVLFHFGFFPVGSTSAVLLGAFLMVITQVVTQQQVYDVVGGTENMRTIFLLLGMMLLAQYFERELLIQNVMARFLKPKATFPKYLFVVTAADFIVAAIFTNDVACVVLTPLILKHWKLSNRPVVELGTLLLGIATTANIGSVTTIFGNPQMALIASKTSDIHFKLSQLDMKRCIFYLWLPAVCCYGINFAFLLIHYHVRKVYIPGRVKLIAAKYAAERTKSPRDHSTNNEGQNVAHASVNPVYEDIELQSSKEPTSIPRPHINEMIEVQRSMSIGSFAGIEQKEHFVDHDFTSTNSKPFQLILCLNVLLIVALFLASSDAVPFDTGDP